MTTPYELLRGALSQDPARPFLTFYDDAAGERIELSVATFDNWVAKTGGLLRDGLSVAPGDRVALLLPAHWQGLVWACAGWAVGACIATTTDASADVAVAGPDTLFGVADAPDVVALSLRPLGGRFTETLPPGVLDYALEVPGYPDDLGPYSPPPADGPALHRGGAVLSFADVIEQARARADELGLETGARVLVSTDDLATAVRDALLVPLVVGGSTVLVRHEDPAVRSSRVESERVTATIPPG